MKKIFFVLLLSLFINQVWSQTESKNPNTAEVHYRIPLIGETAPSFSATSTNGTINFPSGFGRNWKILLSHPQDYTPVCTTEILALGYLQDEFEKLGVKVAVLSTDPLETHIQWKKSIEELNLNNMGSVKIKFPLIDDENLAISKQYGMIQPATNSTKAVRGVFIIDPQNIIQAIYFYPMNIGRSTDELLRMVTALQASAANHVLTPANWKEGKDYLVSIPPTTNKNNPGVVPAGFYSPVWYLWFKKAN